MTNHITFWGDHCHCGVYVLWLETRTDLSLVFGRFNRGQPIRVPAGAYAYVGSAMGAGGTSLAGRLLRHTTRTGLKPPHAIRTAMLDQFRVAGLGASAPQPPAAKRLHWHIDYLVDELAVEIDSITVIRAAARIESDIARRLAVRPGVVPLWPGLGASDAPGETHLLRLPDEDIDWQAVVGSILGLRFSKARDE